MNETLGGRKREEHRETKRDKEIHEKKARGREWEGVREKESERARE